MNKTNGPVFLIGTQRSGTTLLGRMLSAHGDIFIKNEVPVKEVFKPGTTKEDIVAEIDKTVKYQLGHSIKELLAKENKHFWGLKDPQLTEHLEALKQFLPEARFIIIVRDARAVVRSYIENAWGLGTNCYTGALRWRDEVKKQLAFKDKLPDQVMLLRYEDLVTDQRASLKKITDFLAVPFDESMLEYSNSKAFVSRNRQSINAFRAPDPNLASKWKTALTRHQIRVIDSLCNKLLQKLGYEVEAEALSYQLPIWLRGYYRVHQAVIGEIQIQYRWRLARIRRKYSSFRKMKAAKSA